MREEIEEELALWREAVQRRHAADGDAADVDAEIERHQAAFQRLTTEYMIDRIDALKQAEARRANAVPSTPEFHAAARDEARISGEIWDSARVIDNDVPSN